MLFDSKSIDYWRPLKDGGRFVFTGRTSVFTMSHLLCCVHMWYTRELYKLPLYDRKKTNYLLRLLFLKKWNAYIVLIISHSSVVLHVHFFQCGFIRQKQIALYHFLRSSFYQKNNNFYVITDNTKKNRKTKLRSFIHRSIHAVAYYVWDCTTLLNGERSMASYSSSFSESRLMKWPFAGEPITRPKNPHGCIDLCIEWAASKREWMVLISQREMSPERISESCGPFGFFFLLIENDFRTKCGSSRSSSYFINLSTTSCVFRFQ